LHERPNARAVPDGAAPLQPRDLGRLAQQPGLERVLEPLTLDAPLRRDDGRRQRTAPQQRAGRRVAPAVLLGQDVGVDERGGRGPAREVAAEADRDEFARQGARQVRCLREVDCGGGREERGEGRAVAQGLREVQRG